MRPQLRLAYLPPREAPPPPRAWLLARAVLARLWIIVLDLLALGGAIVALLPCILVRRPVARRAQLPRRAGRVIPLPGRGRATPLG